MMNNEVTYTMAPDQNDKMLASEVTLARNQDGNMLASETTYSSEDEIVDQSSSQQAPSPNGQSFDFGPTPALSNNMTGRLEARVLMSRGSQKSIVPRC
jgi:hypothetical protein